MTLQSRRLSKLIFLLIVTSALTYSCKSLIKQEAQVNQNPNKIDAPFEVVASEMNMLFYDINNPITARVLGFPDSSVVISCDQNIELSSIRSGIYSVKVPKGIREVKLLVSVKTESGLKEVGYNKFRVREIGIPYACISQFDGLETLDFRILNNKSSKLSAQMQQSFPYNMEYVVTQYSITYISSTGSITKMDVIGNTFPEEFENIFRSSKTGDMLVFDNIIAEEQRHQIKADLRPLVLKRR